jgi:hypothetical protein
VFLNQSATAVNQNRRCRREVPAFLQVLERAAAAGCHPQLLLVDGFGVLHPRRCGSASHLGVLSGLPTGESGKGCDHGVFCLCLSICDQTLGPTVVIA